MNIYKPGDIVKYRRASDHYVNVLLEQVFDATAIGREIERNDYTLTGPVLVVLANITNIIPAS